MIEKFSLLGLEPLALTLDQTEFRTVEGLLLTKEFLTRIELFRNRLGLGFIVVK